MRAVPVYVLLALLLLTPRSATAQAPAGPGQSDRCPVCGMFVARYPDWVASLVFKDGTQLFFDGPKDLFRYYFSLPNQHDSRTAAAVARLYVTEYYSTRLVPADQLYYISGSDIYGPMGAELVPVAGKAAAESFFSDHKGQKLLSFAQINQQQLPPE